MHCGFGSLNPVTLDKLSADIDIYTWEWVEEAIEIGNMRGKRNYSYIKGILNNWQTNGKEEKNESGRKNKTDTGTEERDYSTPVDISKFKDDDFSDLL